MDRRKFLTLSAAVVMGLTLVPAFNPAFGATKLEEEIQKRLGVQLSQIREVEEIRLTAPTIAESGANVPITVESNIPIEQVDQLWVFVDKNPIPWIADVKLT
ncbi:MAG: thiosulfate oxidation carrier protein SoxY, partial [Aquificaceae bacterium]